MVATLMSGWSDTGRAPVGWVCRVGAARTLPRGGGRERLQVGRHLPCDARLAMSQ